MREPTLIDSLTGWRAWIPAVVLTVGVALSGVAMAAMPRDNGTLALIIPSADQFAQAAAIIDAAGGRIKTVGGWGHVVVTDLQGAAHADALSRQGAWLVIDASVAKGCIGL